MIIRDDILPSAVEIFAGIADDEDDSDLDDEDDSDEDEDDRELNTRPSKKAKN